MIIVLNKNDNRTEVLSKPYYVEAVKCIKISSEWTKGQAFKYSNCAYMETEMNISFIQSNPKSNYTIVLQY